MNMLIYLIFICVILMLGLLVYSTTNRESFKASDNTPNNIKPDHKLRQMLNNINRKNETLDMNQYVKRTAVEQSARVIAKEYCPVPADYNSDDYVKKSEVREKTCPKVPDLKDFVLKSSIPPVQQCPSCVCPKVKVESGLSKDCPKPNIECPGPKPCNFEQCKNIIKCVPGEKMVPPCDTCPPPQPCPTEPPKVCPAFKLPTLDDIKCPPCKYYGVKESKKDINQLLSDMIANNENDKLLKLKERLNELDIQDPEELEKTINRLREQLKKTSHNHPNMDGKLDEILNALLNLKNTQSKKSAVEYDVDEEDETTTSATTVQPTSSGEKCQSYPMQIKKYDTYKLLGASVV